MTTQARARPLTNLLALLGLVAVGGLPTFIITIVLIGPPLAGTGVLALATLAAYFWVAAKVTRKVLAA